MKPILDLKDGLASAYQKNLIRNFEFHPFFIDIEFLMRDESTRQKINQLRDYILASYESTHGAEYMPIANKLRIYLCK